MEQATNFKAQLDEICAAFGPFALGWNMHKLRTRIFEIKKWREFNGETVIPLDRRHEVARDANSF